MASLKAFTTEMENILVSAAKEKGYSDGDIEVYKNELMDFVESNFPGHALGEIVYKAQRYKRKEETLDLVKIAAWAALIWMRKNS